MASGSSRPEKFFAGIGFNERYKPRRVVEHCWPNVDELIDAVRLREHPTHAMRAKKVSLLPVQPPYDRLPFGNHEPTARKHGSQRIRAGAHSLTPRTVAGHRQNRQCGSSNAQLPAPAPTVPRQSAVGSHRLLLTLNYDAASIPGCKPTQDHHQRMFPCRRPQISPYCLWQSTHQPPDNVAIGVKLLWRGCAEEESMGVVTVAALAAGHRVLARAYVELGRAGALDYLSNLNGYTEGPADECCNVR